LSWLRALRRLLIIRRFQHKREEDEQILLEVRQRTNSAVMDGEEPLELSLSAMAQQQQNRVRDL
jgi:hypothetical protein